MNFEFRSNETPAEQIDRLITTAETAIDAFPPATEDIEGTKRLGLKAFADLTHAATIITETGGGAANRLDSDRIIAALSRIGRYVRDIKHE